ncbi:unnamed protein product [Phaedon cochleariae]|uniref:Uncharacterized protein n=1 Tax=Phaedon cochleariae TaxID=80249 RepID=A0A9P0DQI6_PHACE|nr:unnamed protein product [Phaedon cochleariae]
MLSNEYQEVTLGEVNEALKEIENKYSNGIPNINSDSDGFEETLAVLSKEYDSVGLPTLDLSASIWKVFKQVVSGARSLIQIHRRTIAKMKDVNIDNRCKDTRSGELYKIIDDCKTDIDKAEEKNSALKNKMKALLQEISNLKKYERVLRTEMEQVKRINTAQQNQLTLEIKKLTRENQRLKETLGTDLNIYQSKDQVVLKLLGKYKSNEDIFKSTIQKLQGNNKELLHEVFSLREQLSNVSKDCDSAD